MDVVHGLTDDEVMEGVSKGELVFCYDGGDK